MVWNDGNVLHAVQQAAWRVSYPAGLVCGLAFWFVLLAPAVPAVAVTPAMNVTPGQALTVPASTGWEVILDECGQRGTTGPTGSSYFIGPPDAATISGGDPNSALRLSDSIGIQVCRRVCTRGS